MNIPRKKKKKKKRAKTKEFMEDNDENVEKREVDVVNVNRFKKVPKRMEDEDIEAMMDSNVNHISLYNFAFQYTYLFNISIFFHQSEKICSS